MPESLPRIKSVYRCFAKNELTCVIIISMGFANSAQYILWNDKTRIAKYSKRLDKVHENIIKIFKVLKQIGV